MRSFSMNLLLSNLLALVLLQSLMPISFGFQQQKLPRHASQLLQKRSTFIGFSPNSSDKNELETTTTTTFVNKRAATDPFKLSSKSEFLNGQQQQQSGFSTGAVIAASAATTALALAAICLLPGQVSAVSNDLLSAGVLDPKNFVPVCPASDAFYRFLQGSTVKIVGPDAFTEYGPLIAGGFLRIRLELCVVESFFNEAVVPFIRDNGFSWILPLHETVETFLAGTIFSLATAFILVGSSKILTVLATYFDFFLGIPSRIFGGFFFDRACGKPVTLDFGIGPFKTRLVGPPQAKDAQGNVIEREFRVDLSNLGPIDLIILILSGVVKYTGELLGFIRRTFEGLDLFVGRDLLLWATAYIIIKFLHFKVFTELPF